MSGHEFVIDAEDREQLKPFVQALRGAVEGAGLSHVSLGQIFTDEGVEVVRAALLALIAPPRPEEPTGLGAVVSAKCVHSIIRREWVRSSDGNWYADGEPDDWDSLIDPEVLTDGWKGVTA